MSLGTVYRKPRLTLRLLRLMLVLATSYFYILPGLRFVQFFSLFLTFRMSGLPVEKVENDGILQILELIDYHAMRCNAMRSRHT